MRRVRYSVATSLDGYIAGPSGEIDWIVMDPDMDFAARMAAFDIVLMGRKTYKVAVEHGPGAVMPGMVTYVFSRTLSQDDCPGVTVSSEPAETVATLKNQPGKDIWLFGGGSLFKGLLDLGLVDTVEVTIIPSVLGDGVPLLPAGSKLAKLKLTNHQVYEKTGTVALEYEIA